MQHKVVRIKAEFITSVHSRLSKFLNHWNLINTLSQLQSEAWPKFNPFKCNITQQEHILTTSTA